MTTSKQIELTYRMEALLGAVIKGEYDEFGWAEVPFSGGSFLIMSDALQVKGVRVNVTHEVAQIIADILGMSLPTTRMMDLAHAHADCMITPCTQPPGPQMDSITAMNNHSKAVDRKIEFAGQEGKAGLISTVCKVWVLSNQLLLPNGKAHPVMDDNHNPIPGTICGCNFGWHMAGAKGRSPGGAPVIQSVGRRHDYKWHLDYSQCFIGVNSIVKINGNLTSLQDILKSKDKAYLLSDEGPLLCMRHPAVPYYSVETEEPVEMTRDEPRKVDKNLTPCTEQELCEALRLSHNAIYGEMPTENRLGVAWAQCALELGRGKAIWNNNIGNITAGKSWQGDWYELKVPPPDPPVLKFRAHDSIVDGAIDYWSIIDGRYKSALLFFDSGSADAACRELGRLHYFLANPDVYAPATARLFEEFKRRKLFDIADDTSVARHEAPSPEELASFGRLWRLADDLEHGAETGMDVIDRLGRE